jgi:uncharacterized protein (TIGR00369 family)
MSPLQGFDPDKPFSQIGELIGRELVRMENGLSEVHFELGDIWLNMQGILHGGAFATMLDTACGVAARSVLDMEKYRGQVTLELKTSYLKAGHPGKYIAKGKVLRMGRSVSFSEAVLLNEQGEEVARASATFKLLPREAS